MLPDITEQMAERLRELRQSREQLISMVHAHDGAIEECERWLNTLKGEQGVSEST